MKPPQAATRQIPVAAIAALEKNARTDVVVTGCEPGFYYTLHDAADLGSFMPRSEGVAGTVDVYGPRLCGTDGEVEFDGVVKPSDAAGFFTIGVKETPDVQPSDR